MRVGKRGQYHWELNNFPGCNQIVVSNHAWVKDICRGTGLGQEQHKARIDTAQDLGYNYMMCTVREDNKAQIHILEKNGWKLLDNFMNTETEHQVRIYGKSL